MISNTNNNILDSTYIFFIYVLVFLIPSGVYSLSGGAIIVLILLRIAIYIKSKEQLKKNSSYMLIFLGLLYVCYFLKDISILNNSQIFPFLSFLFFPFLLSYRYQNKQVENIFKVFILSTILFLLMAYSYAIYGTIQDGSSHVFLRGSNHSKFLGYGLIRIFYNWHPTYISLFSNFSIVLILSRKVKFSSKLVTYLILLTLMVSLITLQSLTGILAFSVALVVLYLSKKKITFKTIIYSILLLLSFGVFFYSNPLNIKKIDSIKNKEIVSSDVIEESNSLNIRLVKWKAVAYTVKRNIWLGVSPYFVKDELSKYYIEMGYDRAAKRKFGPHNQFFNILTSFGVLGLLVFLFILLYPLLKNPDQLYVFLLIVFCVFSLTEDVLERQQGILFFSFFYTFILNMPKKIES